MFKDLANNLLRLCMRRIPFSLMSGALIALSCNLQAPLTAYDAAQCRAIADGDAALMRRYGAAPPPDPALPDPDDWMQRALQDSSVPSGTGNDWLRALREQDAALQKAITDHDLLH